jgi:hypothetical protein
MSPCTGDASDAVASDMKNLPPQEPPSTLDVQFDKGKWNAAPAASSTQANAAMPQGSSFGTSHLIFSFTVTDSLTSVGAGQTFSTNLGSTSYTTYADKVDNGPPFPEIIGWFIDTFTFK